jgi:hypothetical protein
LHFEFELPNNIKGYTIGYQTCCRIDNITNTLDQTGVTYSGEIPGSSTLGVGFDNSARFQTGINVICNGKPFVLDFSATDPDGDQLVYSFVNAYNGGEASATNGGSSYATPAAPPYGPIPYTGGYSGSQPLGPLATINI